MKLLFIGLFLVSASFTTLAQLVDFRNHQSDFATPADRDVYHPFDCLPLVGTNYQARLLYGSDAASLQPATYITPARFRNVTTGHVLAGTWQGGTRTLVGFTVGQTVTLAVQVWDSTGDLTFEQALAAGRLVGSSDPFSYTIPSVAAPATAFYMNNFRSFGCIPEPSAVALGFLGLASLFLSKKRRH